VEPIIEDKELKLHLRLEDTIIIPKPDMKMLPLQQPMFLMLFTGSSRKKVSAKNNSSAQVTTMFRLLWQSEHFF